MKKDSKLECTFVSLFLSLGLTSFSECQNTGLIISDCICQLKIEKLGKCAICHIGSSAKMTAEYDLGKNWANQ